MPSAWTRSISGVRPFGKTSGETNQSPRLVWSLRRPPNHPSSRTNRSMPSAAASSASAIKPASERSKPSASHELRCTLRWPHVARHGRISVRAYTWNACANAERSGARANMAGGVVKLSPGGTTTSPRDQPAPIISMARPSPEPCASGASVSHASPLQARCAPSVSSPAWSSTQPAPANPGLPMALSA